MIVYRGTKRDFVNDVNQGNIAKCIQKILLNKLGINKDNTREFESWQASLPKMKDVIDDKDISDDVQVAIEYQIPLTAKRVDFLIEGMDKKDNEKVLVIELKQWEKAIHIPYENLVKTYVAGAERPVVHPSYQAYSYAQTILNFNQTIREDKVQILPCAYLHNFSTKYESELKNEEYTQVVSKSPLFFKSDKELLNCFVKSNIIKPTNHPDYILDRIEFGKIKPSKSLQECLASMLNGNQEFQMIDEQQVTFSLIKDIVLNKLKNTNDKYTIVVQGGPGTGKSVIAVNLLVKLNENRGERDNLNICYTTKNAAPRKVFIEKLRKNHYELDYIKNLFKSSGSFIDSLKNEYDCIICDEAHRLTKKTQKGRWLTGENQILEIINASRVSIFFIDQNQKVTTKDFGTIDEIKRCANLLNSKLIFNENTILKSQFRCNGSDGYIAFLNDLLGIESTANSTYFDLDYDLEIFDNPRDLRDKIIQRNIETKNKARIVAGYCWEWVSKNNPNQDIYDIVIPDKEFKAQWNFNNTKNWAIDENSINQIGCIHTSQGLEFDYIGVIIGKDLRYENGQIITDKFQRARSDKSLYRSTPDKDADEIIKNTYKTLMTRGQKGCYIYCEDKPLSEYIKSRLEILKKRKEEIGKLISKN